MEPRFVTKRTGLKFDIIASVCNAEIPATINSDMANSGYIS